MVFYGITMASSQRTGWLHPSGQEWLQSAGHVTWSQAGGSAPGARFAHPRSDWAHCTRAGSVLRPLPAESALDAVAPRSHNLIRPTNKEDGLQRRSSFSLLLEGRLDQPTGRDSRQGGTLTLNSQRPTACPLPVLLCCCQPCVCVCVCAESIHVVKHFYLGPRHTYARCALLQSRTSPRRHSAGCSCGTNQRRRRRPGQAHGRGNPGKYLRPSPQRGPRPEDARFCFVKRRPRSTNKQQSRRRRLQRAGARRPWRSHHCG
jgi:hypothetical protein